MFQSRKKEEIIKEAKRVLKNDGRIVVIEWLKGASMAPEEGWLISKDEIRNLVSGQELVLDKELSLDDQHYGMIFKKS